MECLYLEKKNKCIALKNKQCDKCSFYKEKTNDNFNKFILKVEKDILLYPNRVKEMQSGF